MVEGRRKSRSKRRLQRRTPGKRIVQHYIGRKHALPQCASCGNLLKGVPRASSNEIQNMSKSQRRPERPYGGVLCSPCSRRTIIHRVRNIFSLSKKVA